MEFPAIRAARQMVEFTLPSRSEFHSFPAPLQAVLFTNEDPREFHAATLQKSLVLI